MLEPDFAGSTHLLAGREGRHRLGRHGVPETFVVDPEGIIRYKQIGPIDPRP